MSANVVQAHYEQLEQVAARFATAAETQQALLQQVNQRVDVLRQGGWQGKGIAAFLQEMDGEVSPAGQQLIDALNDAARTTAQISMVVRQAEIEAASLFQGAADRSLFGDGAGQASELDQSSYSSDTARLDNAADLYAAIENSDQPISIRRIGPGKDGKGEYVILVRGTYGDLDSNEAWWGDHSNSWWSAVGSGVNQRTVYVDRILEAAHTLPEGATIHFAGHSQGGHAIQIAASQLGGQGDYTVGSVTGFGTYRLDTTLPGVPVNIYNSQADPVHVIDMVRDSMVIAAGSILISSVSTPAVGVLWAGYSIITEARKETIITESFGHSDYESSEYLKNTPLAFGSGRGQLIAEFNAPKVNVVQKAVEFTGEMVVHSSSELPGLILAPLSL